MDKRILRVDARTELLVVITPFAAAAATPISTPAEASRLGSIPHRAIVSERTRALLPSLAGFRRFAPKSHTQGRMVVQLAHGPGSASLLVDAAEVTA
ncbi:MAG TPA: hypothetical protein VGM37_09620 [Armatimonadota bacterium]|jgi:hypothetical protein